MQQKRPQRVKESSITPVRALLSINRTKFQLERFWDTYFKADWGAGEYTCVEEPHGLIGLTSLTPVTIIQQCYAAHTISGEWICIQTDIAPNGQYLKYEVMGNGPYSSKWIKVDKLFIHISYRSQSEIPSKLVYRMISSGEYCGFSDITAPVRNTLQDTLKELLTQNV